MKTYYIKFFMVHHDAVWGMEKLEGCHTGLIRCTRNRLRKAVFEWCATGRELTAEEMAFYKRRYPMAEQF